MKYDFGHWGDNLPKVSCQCITYGRTNLLDEAVESFLRQDYRGEKELVILNDYKDLEIFCDIPNIKVFNFPYRIKSIGEKRNVCVSLCSGDIIFPWDDDDISLPFRISYSLEKMKNKHYYKSNQLWFWSNGKISKDPRKNIAHAMGAWSIDLFKEVGGYPTIQSGQDQAIEGLFRKTNYREVEKTPLDKIYYIYRFPGTKSYHLSTCGYGKGFQEVEKYVKKKEIKGEHKIKPHWSQDFIQMTKNLVKENYDIR